MADPTEDLKPPQLKPWYLNYRYDYDAPLSEVVVSGVSRRRKMQKYLQEFDEELEVDDEVGDTSLYYKTETKTFENIEVGDLDLVFQIPKTYNIPSDEKAYHSIFIQSIEVAVTYKHIAIPKVKKGAYLILGVPNWKKLGLISAPVYLYLRGTYLGESSINTETIKNVLDLSLGRDTWVGVEQSKAEKVSKKFLGANVQETHSSTITIKNNYNTVLKLTLSDQVPVSQNSDIEVIINNLNGARQDQRRGFIHWKVQIPANSQRDFNFSYTIKYPKSKPPIIKVPQSQKLRTAKFRR